MSGGSPGSPGSAAAPAARAHTSTVRALKAGARAAERASVTTPRSVSRPLVTRLAATVAWTRSPASLPWRGDLLRAALAPVVAGAAALAPAGPVPLTAVLLVAGAYLLLVVTAALGRLDDGVRVPPGVLLGLDALHLFWAAHLTSGLGGPLPVVAATAGTCLLLRIALLPPVAGPSSRRSAAARPRRTTTVDLRDGSAARPSARRCPACPHGRGHHAVRPLAAHGAQREGLELARAEA